MEGWDPRAGLLSSGLCTGFPFLDASLFFPQFSPPLSYYYSSLASGFWLPKTNKDRKIAYWPFPVQCYVEMLAFPPGSLLSAGASHGHTLRNSDITNHARSLLFFPFHFMVLFFFFCLHSFLIYYILTSVSPLPSPSLPLPLSPFPSEKCRLPGTSTKPGSLKGECDYLIPHDFSTLPSACGIKIKVFQNSRVPWPAHSPVFQHSSLICWQSYLPRCPVNSLWCARETRPPARSHSTK